MASWAKPGVKCVCIKEGSWSIENMNNPTFGQLLTIRSTYISRGGCLYLRFNEIRNKPMGLTVGFVEPGFRRDRFRPLITKTQEQDIEMFLRIANDTPFHVMIDEELYPIA